MLKKLKQWIRKKNQLQLIIEENHELKRKLLRLKKLQGRIDNTQDFQLAGGIDLLLGKRPVYDEMWQKYKQDLQILVDRILFYHLSTDKLLKSQDTRQGFEYAYDVLLETLRNNIQEIKEEREMASLDESDKKESEKIQRDKQKLY